MERKSEKIASAEKAEGKPEEGLGGSNGTSILELHVCRGLNACKGHDVAGIDPHALRGTATGVFAGTAYQDYSWLILAADPKVLGTIFNASSVVSGRLSYTLGLEGPLQGAAALQQHERPVFLVFVARIRQHHFDAG